MANAWVVRAGAGGAYVDDFIDNGYIGMGYGSNLGELSPSVTREELAERFRTANPTWKRGKIANVVGQVYRFLSELSVGDTVVTGDPSARLYYLGRIEGDAELHQAEEDFRWRRKVSWVSKAPRDVLRVDTRNTLGAIQSLFRLSTEALDDLKSHAVALDSDASVPEAPPRPPDDDGSETASALDQLREEIVEKSREFIQDKIAALDPDEMERLVAGVLRAMGYKTRISAKGPDRGVDVFASPDGLGLQEPRIFVEVKHRGSRMGSQEIRAFLGGRQTGDRCLYVSTGGFSREAKYEADRSSIPVTLIDLRSLQELVTEHYEAMDVETKQLVPLKHLYWPIEADQ